ncbi:MAG: QacE family quaternary ammonium compound efflux SMR transporter [Rhodobacteraceae bacterium]|jgi:small multidrug resistance pump|nr:QacE family quaternary ammonium compound efflux SMR transporter [Paracoccaceae bacterium]MBT4285564.1 QacE family quaternary ammonium compound efflux SMR transporter [Paracoccaceae bacterium]MBT4777250.1 QacE family quaternary ammonium compound efflux SMR transporter [Paracoccaceae bacterium]MBT6271066.1 QacE family quaternary ammonium compound efflux SMR transporter [Paracoccaceae bacterium]|tara:strand:+ start:331 stop:663 length:333 start_codon:yes stop_codon:yes gene_type:complete
MNIYITLFAAVALEVLGTMLLPVTKSFTKMLPSIVVVLSYGISIYFLAILSQKLSLAIIYASWAGLGVFSVTFLSYIFFKQALNWQTILGLFLIVLGVIIVNLYKGQSTF